MHIKCLKKELLSELKIICPITFNKTSSDLIKNILFFTDEEGYLNLMSTNFEITMKTKIKVEIIEEGKTLIPSKKILEIIQ